MAGISLSGLASGIDTAALIDGLMSAASAPRSQLVQQKSANQAAVTSLSNLSSALATLQNAVEELDTASEVAAYSATSSSSAIVPTASSSALKGQYSVAVDQLATAQKTYSKLFAAKDTDAGLSGDLQIQVGSGATATVTVAGKTLTQIASEISALGERVSATVVSDGSGSGFRLLVRGLDTGEDNLVVFSDTGAAGLGVNTTSYASSAFNVADTTTVAAGQSGMLSIAIGTSSAVSVSISASDTLTQIASKITAAAPTVGVTISGSAGAYKLELQRTTSGSASGDGLSFTESGTSFGFGQYIGTDTSLGYTATVARDAVVRVDGFRATSSTNTISDVLGGVSLAVSEVTTSAATVTVETDPDEVSSKVSSIVTAYNAVVRAAHTAAGFGTTKAAVAQLAADSAIRRVTDLLQGAVAKQYQSGTYGSPASVGITLSRDGTMSLDSTKLAAAIAADAASVQNLFAGTTASASSGFMDRLTAVVDTLTDSVDGVVTKRIGAFNDKIELLGDRIDVMDRNLALYRANLVKQFTAMEQAYSASQTLLGRLKSIGA